MPNFMHEILITFSICPSMKKLNCSGRGGVGGDLKYVYSLVQKTFFNVSPTTHILCSTLKEHFALISLAKEQMTFS